LAEFRITFAIADEHIARRRRWGHLASINRHKFSIRQPDQHEATTADAGIMRIHHAERETDRNRRINGVATGFQYVETDLGRERMRRRNNTAFGLFGGATQSSEKAKRQDQNAATEITKRTSLIMKRIRFTSAA